MVFPLKIQKSWGSLMFTSLNRKQQSLQDPIDNCTCIHSFREPNILKMVTKRWSTNDILIHNCITNIKPAHVPLNYSEFLNRASHLYWSNALAHISWAPWGFREGSIISTGPLFDSFDSCASHLLLASYLWLDSESSQHPRGWKLLLRTSSTCLELSTWRILGIVSRKPCQVL